MARSCILVQPARALNPTLLCAGRLLLVGSILRPASFLSRSISVLFFALYPGVLYL
jgi:hypothetical protein